MRIEAHTSECMEGDFDSVEEFRTKFPGWAIDAIDSKEVIGQCEGCAKPILEAEEYHQWADGVITCAGCGGPTPEDMVTARGERE